MTIIIQKSAINQAHQHVFNIYSLPGIMLFTIGEHKEQESLWPRCPSRHAYLMVYCVYTPTKRGGGTLNSVRVWGVVEGKDRTFCTTFRIQVRLKQG